MRFTQEFIAPKREKPFAAASANAWVAEQGAVVFQTEAEGLLSANSLYGELSQKSLVFVGPHPQDPERPTVLAALPKILPRRQTRETEALASATRHVEQAFLLAKALQVALSGQLFAAPDGRLWEYSQTHFAEDFGFPPEEAPEWIAFHKRMWEMARSMPDVGEPIKAQEPEGRKTELSSGLEPDTLSSSHLFLVSEVSEAEKRVARKKPGQVWLKAAAYGVPVLAMAAACAPLTETLPSAPNPQGESETSPLPTLEPTPTLRPGGPDDETVNGAPLPWPSSLAEIPEVRADGGPFSFDIEEPNVVAQIERVEDLVTASGWSLVSTPDQLTSGRTAFVAPFQDQDQWSVQAITLNGVLAPVRVDAAGNQIVMDRPDWATAEVARYVELEQELGTAFLTRYELINGHWLPVVRDSQGRRAGFYDIQGPVQEYEYDSEVLAVATGMELAGVVRVEQREEKWIGFDEGGHPIWQSTDPSGKEWERFERELKNLCIWANSSKENNPCGLLTPEMLEPIDASLVRPIQFVDAEDQIVEVEDGRFPGLDEDYYREGELRGQDRAVAGVIRGYVLWPFRAGYRNPGTPQSEPIIEYETLLYIEVRLNEFASQGFFYPIPDKYTNMNIFFLKALDPELGPNGEVSYDHVPLSHEAVTELFIDNESAWINQQVIFGIQTYSYYFYDEEDIRNYALIMEALESGKPTDLEFLWMPTELYVPSELVP